jgi:hypothetical protein
VRTPKNSKKDGDANPSDGSDPRPQSSARAAPPRTTESEASTDYFTCRQRERAIC